MRVGRRFIAAVASVATLTGLTIPLSASHAAAATQVTYFFHRGSSPVNQLDVLNSTPPSFDSTVPTSSSPALAADTSILTNTGSTGIGDPTWTGTVGSTINTLKVDLWQQAPVGSALGSVEFDVTVFVGDTAKFLGTMTGPADPGSITEVSNVFSAADPDSPLPIDPAGQPVTISINGHYADAESVSTIFYDSTQYPSGFSINVPAPTNTIQTVARASGAATFAPPVNLPDSTGFGEPSIAVAPPGTQGTAGKPQTIWASAPSGLTTSVTSNTASPVWRSDDGGLTFTKIQPNNAGPVETGLGGGDTDIKTDKDGNVYMADLWLGNDSISISQDKGQTWIGSPLSHPQHVVDDRQWMAYSAKESAMYMTYDGESGVYLDKASLGTPLGADGALVFPQESLVMDNGSRGCLCPPGVPVVDDSRPGSLPYVYLVNDSSHGIDVARSDDGGLTFSHSTVPGSGTGLDTGNDFQVAAVDGQGNLYVTWAEPKNGHNEVFFASSTDHGQTFSGPFNVSALLGQPDTALFPTMAADGNGHVGIAFYGTPAAVDNNTAPADTKWNVYYAETTDGAAALPAFTMTEAVANFHQGTISTGGLGGSADRSLGDFFQVVFDADHLANIVYTSGTGDSVVLAYLKQQPAAQAATSISYTGARTVAAGGTATYGAKLVSATGAPIVGAPVAFTLGTMAPVTATTDSTGTAVASQPVSLTPGDYAVTARFAGDTARAGSFTSSAFTVTGAPGATFRVDKIGPQDGGGEPSIAAGPEGNLYVSYPGSGMNFFYSKDSGRSWTAGKNMASTASGDTTVNVDSSGAVYTANLNPSVGPNLFQGDVYKTRDLGTTWTKGQGWLLGNNSTENPFLMDRQWTDAYIPPGKTTDQARVYIGYHDFGPNQIWVNTSTDGGKTFGQPVDVITSPEAEAASLCDTVPGGLKVVPANAPAANHPGRVYVLWLGGDLATNLATGCNVTQLQTFHTVWMAYSDDGGTTWTDQLVYDAGFGHDASALFADFTLDNQGNPYTAFAINRGGDVPQTPPLAVTSAVQTEATEQDAAPANQWDAFVMASFDQGRTWNGKSDGTGEPYKVSTGTGTNFFPAIVAGDPGKVDFAYLHTDTVIATTPYGKPMPGGGAGAAWYLQMAQSLNLTSGAPTWATSQVRPEPIHIGDICTLGIFCDAGAPLGADRNLLDFIDVAVDPAGMAHISYTDDHNDAAIFSGDQVGGSSLFGLGFTSDTPARGVYSDPVTVGAHIGTADGIPVTFTIGNQSLTALTQHGIAHATFTLTQRPGDYALTATALGQSVAKDFEILRETSSLSATLVHPTFATARLVDADSGAGIAGRTLTFTDGGTVLGFAITDAAGSATVHLRKAVKKGEVLTVTFAGDDYYISSTATATR